eukprot:2330567-Amphidinium_carterae.1
MKLTIHMKITIVSAASQLLRSVPSTSPANQNHVGKACWLEVSRNKTAIGKNHTTSNSVASPAAQNDNSGVRYVHGEKFQSVSVGFYNMTCRGT